MKMRGFTLMEMVMTIVIGSIITLGITSFIRIGMTGYADTIQRQRLQSQAQFVIEKMSREIRHAVPNSFHVPDVESNCLAFVPIDDSGFYAIAENNIEFLIGSNAELESIVDYRRLVINPTRYDDLQSSSPQSFDVSGLEKSESADTFVISDAASSIGSLSVSGRHYIYKVEDEKPVEVSYCFDDGYDDGYVLRNGTIVANSVDTAASSMNYEQATLHRGGLVHINLVFEQDGERSVYQHDVQVLNVP